MYGGKHLTHGDVTGDTSDDRPLIARQALHAAFLGFTHPISKKPMTFQAPLRPDMRRLVEALREHRTVEVPNIAGATIDLDRMLRG